MKRLWWIPVGLFLVTRGAFSQGIESSPALNSRPETRVIVTDTEFSGTARQDLSDQLGQLFEGEDASSLLNDGLSRHLATALTSSGQLLVLDRKQIDDVLREHGMAGFGTMNLQDATPVGQMLNANYLIFLEIRYGNIRREKEEKLAGWKRDLLVGELGVAIKVVSVATTGIVWDKIYPDLKHEDKETLKDNSIPLTGKASQPRKLTSRDLGPFLDRFLAGIAGKLASDILGLIRPVNIVSFEGDVVQLDRGKGSLALGEVLEVFKRGEEMLDPDGGSLGYKEVLVGTIKVVELREGAAQGRLIEGEANDSCVCRRLREVVRVPGTVVGPGGAKP